LSVIELNLAELDAAIDRKRTGQLFEEQAAEWKDDLRLFIRQSWSILEPGLTFVPGWHIDAICDLLQACEAGKVQRAIINIPPRHMKSLTTSVFWPAWLWTRKPSTKFLCASYGSGIARRDAEKMRSLVTDPWYQSRWPLKLREARATVDVFENTRRGQRVSTTVGGSGTGEGGDIIIIDDPHKAEEAYSDTERRKVLNWHDSTISRAFNNLATGVEVLIMQRLHEEDLTGYLLQRSGWEHLCLPAYYEPSHPFVWPDDPRHDEGDLLWPGKNDEAAMAKLAEEMNFHVAGQLQQRPAALEGEILKRAWWRFYPREQDPNDLEQIKHFPRFERIVDSWDLPLKDGETNDNGAGQVWGIHRADRYLLRSVKQKMNALSAKVAIEETYLWVERRWPRTPHTVLVEKGGCGPDVLKILKREIPGVQEYNPADGGKKERRALAAAVPLESHNVFVRGSLQPDSPQGYDAPEREADLIEECAMFPNGSFDDQVDAFSQAMNWARGKGQARVSTVNLDHVDVGAIPVAGRWQ
jgi:predicted phage terminase large subunit-like protein